jgi:hypothetical protein
VLAITPDLQRDTSEQDEVLIRVETRGHERYQHSALASWTGDIVISCANGQRRSRTM